MFSTLDYLAGFLMLYFSGSVKAPTASYIVFLMIFLSVNSIIEIFYPSKIVAILNLCSAICMDLLLFILANYLICKEQMSSLFAEIFWKYELVNSYSYISLPVKPQAQAVPLQLITVAPMMKSSIAFGMSVQQVYSSNSTQFSL